MASQGADARLLGLASPTTAYRSTRGACDGPDPLLETSTDTGKTWQSVTPSSPAIHEVDTLNVIDLDHVDLLGKFGGNCTTSAISTFTAGEFWQTYPDRTSSVVAVTPSLSSIPVAGVFAVAPNNNGFTIGVFGNPSCAGVSIRTLPTATSANGQTDVGCLSAVTSPTPLGLAQSGETLWLWANDQTYVSSDGGVTWA